MNTLVIRTDTDGSVSWKSYALLDSDELIADLAAHLNTAGVARIEIVVAQP